MGTSDINDLASSVAKLVKAGTKSSRRKAVKQVKRLQSLAAALPSVSDTDALLRQKDLLMREVASLTARVKDLEGQLASALSHTGAATGPTDTVKEGSADPAPVKEAAVKKSAAKKPSVAPKTAAPKTAAPKAAVKKAAATPKATAKKAATAPAQKVTKKAAGSARTEAGKDSPGPEHSPTFPDQPPAFA